MVIIKKRVIKKEVIEYFVICPNCKKEIIGNTEYQTKFNFDIHKKSKRCIDARKD